MAPSRQLASRSGPKNGTRPASASAVEAGAKNTASVNVNVLALLDRAPKVKLQREAAATRQARRLAGQGPHRANGYAREVELISEIYRIHMATKRLLGRQLGDAIEPEPGVDAHPAEDGGTPAERQPG